eukprot:jgi/Psemu1/311598/fgenesh1_kg.795_\
MNDAMRTPTKVSTTITIVVASGIHQPTNQPTILSIQPSTTEPLLHYHRPLSFPRTNKPPTKDLRFEDGKREIPFSNFHVGVQSTNIITSHHIITQHVPYTQHHIIITRATVN